MTDASLYRRVLATVGLFTLAAGDFWRFLAGYPGWIALVVVLFALTVVELVRMRLDVRRLPLTLGLFLAVVVLSITWSAYREWTLLGILATLVTTTFGVFLATAFDLAVLLRCLGAALRWILGLSLLFELIVAVIIRHRILPLVAPPGYDYSTLSTIPNSFYWSRDLLLSGGRIQGIVGNSNLLALVALLALIVFAVQLAARSASRFWLVVWTVIAVGVLGLTRSGTALVAGAAVLVVAVFLAVVRRRSRGRARIVTYVVGAAVLVVGAAVAFLAREPLLQLLGKTDTLTGRTDIWRVVVHYAEQRPVAGWGWVSYWVPWVHPFDDKGFVLHHVRYSQAHDAWLDVLLQLGVIGLVLFALFIATTFGRSWMMAIASRPGRASVQLFPALIMVALLVHSIAESRLLIEICFALVVVCSIVTVRRDTDREALTS
jgi:exopolysaccharide production protein ExoQ